MAIAVQTPAHLSSIGLLKSDDPTFESEINFLMKSALERVSFLPFGYLVDQYRWALFDGTIKRDEMNYKWWETREKYQGIAPPVDRSEDIVDACAKYHVPASVPYIRYFTAYVLEYQFYKQMCLDAQQFSLDPAENKPLHRCDFSLGEHSKEAGERLIKVMKAGSSRPWPETLEEMTGGRKMSANAILDYFEPLVEWLDKQIEDNNIPVGWKSTFANAFANSQ